MYPTNLALEVSQYTVALGFWFGLLLLLFPFILSELLQALAQKSTEEIV